MGYMMEDGIYCQSNHNAIFVGDLIDRGNQNRRVLEIVRDMIDAGHGHAVMGNHEYNAICYHTRKTATDWLRPHSRTKFRQHERFLREYPLGQEDTEEVISWFKTLPLFIEFEEFRVIHGCWDQVTIDFARQNYLKGDNTLKEELIAKSAAKSPEKKSVYSVVERLLKGVEVRLPDPYVFNDKDGISRTNIRVRWWGQPRASYRELALGFGDFAQDLPSDQFPDISCIPFYDKKEKPVFFGHYWLVGTPDLQQNNVCCVDYSAGKGGKLVGYTFENPGSGRALSRENFSWVGDLEDSDE
jgi:hypothetical protein